MKLAVGLPNAIAEGPGSLIIDWAQKAEVLGFSGLSTVDRIAYPNHDSLITLAVAAGATQRIGLFANVLIAPTRNPVLLAKEAASLDELSGGRLLLGLGVGAREDDFSVTGTDFHGRGRQFDAALELMHRAWRGEPVPGTNQRISPRPTTGARVPIMIGGVVDAAITRTVRWGVGWTGGGPVYPSLPEQMPATWANLGSQLCRCSRLAQVLTSECRLT
jgi:alkanesulfonate monooxygenase SsuD/methylene tetrahydromethanopterin reductase-like flavin-dependent oxidoreductase (luciferase family)